MERNENIKPNIEIIDRLRAISDEIIGVSQILLIMYENEVKHGYAAERFIPLKNEIERCGEDIREIVDELCDGESS